MTTDRFEQIKAQYRRWPGDTEPNGNWGADVAWLIDEVERLRAEKTIPMRAFVPKPEQFQRVVIVNGDMTGGSLIIQDANGLTLKVINLGEDGQ